MRRITARIAACIGFSGAGTVFSSGSSARADDAPSDNAAVLRGVMNPAGAESVQAHTLTTAVLLGLASGAALAAPADAVDVDVHSDVTVDAEAANANAAAAGTADTAASLAVPSAPAASVEAPATLDLEAATELRAATPISAGDRQRITQFFAAQPAPEAPSLLDRLFGRAEEPAPVPDSILRKVRKGARYTGDIASQAQPLPDELRAQLDTASEAAIYVQVGNRIAKVDARSRMIVDVFTL